MRLGIFGGTFNPIHLGHLRVAEEAREALQLDRVRFVPARIPPHKDVRGAPSAAERLDLVRCAIQDNPHFEVSDAELRRSGPSYSVDTLVQARTELGPDAVLWFLLGTDAFAELHTWSRFSELFNHASVAVLRRPGDEERPPAPATLSDRFTPTADGYLHRSGNEIRFLQGTLLDISSSRIRAAVARGRSVRYLVPPVAQEFLERWTAQYPQWTIGSLSV